MSKSMYFEMIMSGKMDSSFARSAAAATKQLGLVGAEIDKTNAKQIAAKMVANQRFAARSWKDFTGAVKNTGAALGKVKSEIWDTAKAAAGLVVGNGVLGASIYGIAKSSAGYADAAVKTAQGVAMSTEAFTEMAYAARMAGVSQEQFAKGSGKLNKLAFDAAAGNQKALDSFKRLGVDYRDEADNLKSVERLWGEVSDVIAAIPDEGARLSLAREIFGEEDAKRLIPFLQSGKSGLDEMREAARKLNITLSEQDGKNAEAFNDSFANIGESIRGVTLILGKEMWPTFTKIHGFISSKILEVAQELAVAVKEWDFAKWWEEAEPKVTEAWKSLKDGVKWVHGLAQSMGGWVTVIKSVAKAWLLWRGYRIGKSLLDTGKAVKDLGSKFFDLQRNGTTLGEWLKSCFKGTKDIPKESLKPFAGNLRKSLSDAFTKSYQTAGSAAKGLAKHTRAALSKAFSGVSDAAKFSWDKAGKAFNRDTFSRAFTSMKDAGNAAAKGMRTFAAATWSGVKAAAVFSKTMVVSAGQGIASFASTVAAKALPMLKGLAIGLKAGAFAAAKFGIALLANPIGLAIAGIAALGGAIYLCIKHWDKIKAAVSKAWEAVKGVFVAGWNLLPDWVQEPIGKIVGAIGDFGKKIWSGITKDWERIKGVFTDAWNGIVNAAKAFGGMLSGAVSEVWAAVSGVFFEKFDAIAAAFEGSFIGGLLEIARQFNPLQIFIDAFTKVKDWLMTFDLAKAGAELAKKLGNGILNALSDVGKEIKAAVVSYIPGGEAVMNAADMAKNGIFGAADAAANWLGIRKAAPAAEAVPQFANGGVITRPQLALVGEAGPEVIIPVTRAARARELMGKAAEMMGMARGSEASGGATPFGGGMMRGAAAAGLSALLTMAPAAAGPSAMPSLPDIPAPIVRLLAGGESVTNQNARFSTRNEAGSIASSLPAITTNSATSNAFRAGDSLANIMPGVSNIFGGSRSATSNIVSNNAVSNAVANRFVTANRADSRTVNNAGGSHSSWLSSVANIVNNAGDSTSRAGDMISNLSRISSAWIGGDTANSASSINNRFGDILTSAKAFTFGGRSDVAGDTISNIINTFGGASSSSMTAYHAGNAGNAINNVSTMFGNVLNAANNTSKVSGGVLRSIVNNIANTGNVLDKTVLQQIPAFADGGLVTSPQLAMVGEAGPEVIIPLTRENRARDLMGTAAELMGWSGGGDVGGYGGGAAMQFNFSPTIQVTGGGGDVGAMVERALERAKVSWMRDVKREVRAEFAQVERDKTRMTSR